MKLDETTFAIESREAIDHILSTEGQLLAAQAFTEIQRTIRELPEDEPILGIIFGITMGVREERGKEMTAFSTDCIGLRWGLPAAVAQAVEQALGEPTEERPS